MIRIIIPRLSLSINGKLIPTCNLYKGFRFEFEHENVVCLLDSHMDNIGLNVVLCFSFVLNIGIKYGAE